jgi:hypothetical protein
MIERLQKVYGIIASVTDASVWKLMRHSGGTWSYWLIAGQSYSEPIIANIAGAMMDMIIANIVEDIMSIINYSYYNIFKDGLLLNYLEELLQFFAIYFFY